MANSKLSEYNTYRKVTKWLLLLLGLFPVEDASIFYRSLPYIHLFLNLGTAFGMLGFVRVHITNILVVSKRLGLMVSFLTGSLKLICMIIYHEDAKKLKSLDKYYNNLINNPRFTDMVFNGVTTFRRLSWAVSLLVLLSGSVNVVTPIILIIYQHTHDIEPVKYILPYLSIYPWNVPPNGFLYKFHFIFETVATYSLVAITSSIEPLFTLYVIQMIGQLREMSYLMAHINESNNCDGVVRECVHQYATLLKSRDMVQKMFGPIILWQIVTNAVILCLGIFQLSQMTSISVGQAIFFVAYVFTKGIQTFVCGWTGTKLVDESEKHQAAIYAANWHSNKRFMTSVTIMLAQKPLTLTACHFSVISVDIFVSVLNTTMSYFFLLQTLQHDN